MKKSERVKELQTQSLAVRYRPRKLGDLIGQDRVTAKLEGILKTRNLPSAFLLTGGTGRGKTTIARMIHRYINCDTMNACGKCENCKIENHPDFEELNMSSSRGIDDIRSIVQRAKNRPRMGKIRVILLDEAHQLTPQAQEAFLKPLEEPPPQTLWIISTTDPEKLKKTFLGRCMVMNLEKPSNEQVAGRLKYIAKKEGFVVKSKVLTKIAEATGGHVRNAIQMLENCIAASAGKTLNSKSLLQLIMTDSSESSEQGLEDSAIHLLVACYALSLKSLWKFMLDVPGDWVGLTNKMVYLNFYLIESEIVARHRMVWHTPLNTRFKSIVNKSLGKFDASANIGLITDINEALSELRNDQVTKSGSEKSLMLAKLGKVIKANKIAKTKRPEK